LKNFKAGKHLTQGYDENFEPALLKREWQNDYREMQENMIHGDSVSFEMLIDRMKELMARINQLNFKGT
jgi:hypothetical protein